jgi:hypothetical protein
MAGASGFEPAFSRVVATTYLPIVLCPQLLVDGTGIEPALPALPRVTHPKWCAEKDSNLQCHWTYALSQPVYSAASSGAQHTRITSHISPWASLPFPLSAANYYSTPLFPLKGSYLTIAS